MAGRSGRSSLAVSAAGTIARRSGYRLEAALRVAHRKLEQRGYRK